MIQATQTPQRAQIAIVDDNEAVCRSLSLLLRSKGYGVSIYDSVLTFLERNQPTGFDCLLIDFKMSPHDGFDLIRELRERGEMAPAIMITGWQSEELESLAKKAGFECLIYKPMLDDTLVEALDRILTP